MEPKKFYTKGSAPIVIADDFNGYSSEQLLLPAEYMKFIDSIMIPSGLISDRVEKMAHDIYADYGSNRVHLLCVLKGGEQFFSDLKHYLQRFQKYNKKNVFHLDMDFIRASSYENDSSTGEVKITGADLTKINGKHVLIVEDIIDTGMTMKKLKAYVETFSPASLAVASLVVKDTSRSCGFIPEYAGFVVPDYFVIGYTFDFNDFFRDLEHVCVINEAGKKKYATAPGNC